MAGRDHWRGKQCLKGFYIWLSRFGGAHRKPRSFSAIITSLIGIKLRGVTKIATTRLMPLHVGKGRNISTAIADIIDYVENPQKTDFGKFIYGYECDTRLADAEFVLADEPTGNLDSKTSAEVLGLIKRTSAEFRQTVVMITHNDDIARLADRIVRIEDGKIVE